MSWKYTDGKFYVNEAGNSIYYIEVNPCRCCPDSIMVEYKSPIVKRGTVVYTTYFSSFTPNLDIYIKSKKLRVLE